MEAQVSLRGLSKTYPNGVTALDGIDLDILRGELLVLVGPSGCGKSTLLRTVAGLEEVSSGEIRIEGKRVNELAPGRRGLAMVFQDYALYPHMSVEENLAFGLKMRKLSREEIRRRIDEASSLLGLEGLLSRRPSELSGGQRQRVAIGRAIVKHASLFLFDEPLSNLDAKLRAQTRVELASLHRRLGSTSLYVTHDQTEAMTLADRIAVIHEGRFQQLGTPREIYDRPANLFVAGFIGSPSMNFLRGTVKSEAGVRTFESGGVRLDLTGAPAPERDGPYVLGIRPEALTPVGAGETGDLELGVLLSELHGFESFLICEPVAGSGERITVRSLQPARAGDRLRAALNRAALHWFEPDGQRSISAMKT